MAEKRRLNLAFSLTKPHQREAWEQLCAIPSGRRTDAVCRMLREHQERQELLAAVCAAVREELRTVQFQPMQTEEAKQAGDVDEDVLGFLLSLQEGDEKPDSLF